MRNILVLTDGSDASIACYAYAISMAKSSQAHIDVLYLTDIRLFEMSALADLGGSIGAQPYAGVMEQVQNMERSKADLIRGLAEKFFRSKRYLGRMTFHHRRGFLGDIIGEFSGSDLGVDLAVFGRNGQVGHPGGEGLGSNIAALIKAARVPCLLVPQKYAPIKKMLLAYDGGEGSRSAVRNLIRFGDPLKKELHLVTVDRAGDPEGVDQQLEELKILLTGAKFRVKSERLTGETDRAIRKYIKGQAIDLLIMGAYGHSELRYLFGTSDTKEILTTITIPALIYPAK